MLRVVSQPGCAVVMLDRWDAPPSRYFAAYRARGPQRWILGHSVVDEYGTISSPVFLAPRSLLGKTYNAGISLGHRRDPEMGLDLGWPPLCVGIDRPAPRLPADWETRLLTAICDPDAAVEGELRGELSRVRRKDHEIAMYRLAGATVVTISSPLLPRQLARICDVVPTAVVVAVSLGNRIERSVDGAPLTIRAVSESRLTGILGTVQGVR